MFLNVRDEDERRFNSIKQPHSRSEGRTLQEIILHDSMHECRTFTLTRPRNDNSWWNNYWQHACWLPLPFPLLVYPSPISLTLHTTPPRPNPRLFLGGGGEGEAGEGRGDI